MYFLREAILNKVLKEKIRKITNQKLIKKKTINHFMKAPFFAMRDFAKFIPDAEIFNYPVKAICELMAFVSETFIKFLPEKFIILHRKGADYVNCLGSAIDQDFRNSVALHQNDTTPENSYSLQQS